MRMHDYVSRYDNLSAEDALFRIPLRKEYLLEQIGRGKRVLDVGCLGGQISQLISKQHNEVFAVEVNPVAAAAARKRGIHVVEANVEEGLPFEDRFFDVVNAGEIVEHLFDTKSFLLECRRVLRKDGFLVFTTPNLNSLENRLRVLKGEYLSNVGAYPEDRFGEHVRILNVEKIRELCAQTGFEIEEIRGVFGQAEGPASGLRARAFGVAAGLASRLLPQYSRLLIVKARKTEGFA